MKKLLFLFILFSFNSIFAQYGWTQAEVTLKNGSVLKGQASLTLMGNGINLSKEKLKYRANSKSKKKKYAIDEVEQILFTVTYKEKVGKKNVEKTRIEKYITVFLNKKQDKLGFVELMVDGDIRMVGRTISVQTGGTHFGGNPNVPFSQPVFIPGYMGRHNQVMFLKKGQKPEVFNKISLTKSFRKRAMKYFENCPVLKNKIDKKEFKKEDLQEIVKFYNSNCN